MSKQQKLIRSIRPEVRVIDEAQGLVDYVASDETVDWYDELVVAAGWEFDLFRRNAPFVDSHDYSTIEKQLGAVESFEVRGNQLIERVRWAVEVKENPLIQVGWKMTVGGFLKAVSVGFVPSEVLVRGQNGWDELMSKLGLGEADKRRLFRVFLRQQQYELSACIIGANPNALLKSYQEGAVAEGELAGLGFGEDETFDFLEKAAGAWENPALDEVGRAMVAVEMKRIFAGRAGTKDFGKKPEHQGPAPSARDTGAEAERRAVKRAEILKQLRDLGE